MIMFTNNIHQIKFFMNLEYVFLFLFLILLYLLFIIQYNFWGDGQIMIQTFLFFIRSIYCDGQSYAIFV